MGDDELGHFLESIRRHVDQTVARLPKHMDYIRSYCAMKQPAA
jgi:tryptophan halogenase